MSDDELVDALRKRLAELATQRDEARRVCLSLAQRCKSQSDLLSMRAETPVAPPYQEYAIYDDDDEGGWPGCG